MDEAQEEIPSKVPDLETMVESKQSSERVQKILLGLPARDRELLRAVFWEEKDKDTVCRDIGANRNYLRVLLRRAKKKFKVAYEGQDWRVRCECPHEKFGRAMFATAKSDRTIPAP